MTAWRLPSGRGSVASPPGRWIRSTASGVPTSLARPPSTRSPVPAAISANFTDELPELRTSTDSPEAAMARMLPGPDESVMPGTAGTSPGR